jgi:spiro-SPASM protein
MKLAAVIYAGSLSPHALVPIGAGGSAYERCLEFVRRLPGLGRAVVAEGSLRLPEGAFPKRHRESWTFDQVLEEMADIGQGADAVLLAWADEPFLDPLLAAKMLEDFRRYRAEYGFADGYPGGLAAEILAPRLIPAVRGLAGALPPEPTRTSLFTAIQRDINAFDIETDISPVDLRDLRLSLACDTKRNSLLVERLESAGVSDALSALRLIPENLGLLRTLPAFIQIQVAAGCPQVCRLCPYPLFGPTGGSSAPESPASGSGILGLRRDMPRAKFASLLDQVVELCEDAVIDISLWGESSMHSDIGGMIGEVMSRPSLSLIIETSGLGWTDAFEEKVANRIVSSGGADRVDWVLSLDAASPELYAELRGEGFAEATAFAERLIGLFPGRAHVQMVRARENEAELETFWRGWKKKTEKVIVQKYSRFAGLLPERKVSDLSPLSRKPCWHLKRDLSILIDGTIPLCRDFSYGDIILGNAFEAREGRPAGLAAAWAAGESYHVAHIEACRSGEASRFPSPCEACDEYYTYNA